MDDTSFLFTLRRFIRACMGTVQVTARIAVYQYRVNKGSYRPEFRSILTVCIHHRSAWQRCQDRITLCGSDFALVIRVTIAF